MINLTENLLVNKYKIKHNVFELYKQALNDIEDQLKVYDEIRGFTCFPRGKNKWFSFY